MKRLVILFLLLGLLLAACGSGEEEALEPTEPPPSPTARPTATRRPTATPLPSPTPTPAPLTSVEIMKLVSPSVAFVETPAGTGSGVLIRDLAASGDSRYLLTNAHVVWPYTTARVVFRDGTVLEELPIVNTDLMFDLAVLGPIHDQALQPLDMGDGESLPIGSEVYLIGYPGEVEKMPSPTVSKGILSRLRQWDSAELTYLQTDAAATYGQSGGVLVDEYGTMIGLSTYLLNGSAFVLAMSASDLQPWIADLIQGEDVDQLGDRSMPDGEGLTSRTITLQGEGDYQTFMFDLLAGEELEIVVDGDGDAAFDLIDPTGYLAGAVDDTYSGPEQISYKTEVAGPHFLIVVNFAPDEQDYRISSNQEFLLARDPDDGRTLFLDETAEYIGALDYPGDGDALYVELAAGEEVTLRAQSAMVDVYLWVGFDGAGEEQIVEDDDTGAGLFGTDALLTYRAPHDGEYYVVLESAYGNEVGGYSLTMSLPGPDDPEPTVIAPLPTPVTTEVGDMLRYESDVDGFTFLYPSSLSERTPPESPLFRKICEMGELTCFANPDGLLLTVLRTDLTSLGMESIPATEYLELSTEMMAGQGATVEVLSVAPIERDPTVDGLIADLRADMGILVISYAKLILLRDGVLYEVTYITPDDSYNEAIAYSFASFEWPP